MARATSFLVDGYLGVVCNHLEQPLGDPRLLDSGEDVGACVPLHHEVGGLHLGAAVVYGLQGPTLPYPLLHLVAVHPVGGVTAVAPAPPAGDDRDAPQCTTDVPVERFAVVPLVRYPIADIQPGGLHQVPRLFDYELAVVSFLGGCPA